MLSCQAQPIQLHKHTDILEDVTVIELGTFDSPVPLEKLVLKRTNELGAKF